MTDSTMLVCTALIAFAFVCLMKYVQANMIEARRELQRAEDEIRWLRSEVEALNEGGHSCPTMTHEDLIEPETKPEPVQMPIPTATARFKGRSGR